MNIDLEELAAVVRLLREAEFSELRYSKGDVSLLVRRGNVPLEVDDQPPAPVLSTPVRNPAPASVVPAPADPADSRVALVQGAHSHGPSAVIKAPLLGSFYRAPKPGEPPFVEIGDRVEAQTVVCIIEVMKLMNSVEAGVSGVITAIHPANGELVEHGDALFSIELTEAGAVSPS